MAETSRSNSASLWWPAALTGLVLLAGCATIGQDFDDLARSLSPPTPGEAARMAVNQDDPDERREGLIWLASAPFGATEPYLAMYRDYAAREPNALVRAVALRALSRHGDPALDAPLIAEQLDHASPTVRWEAAKGLQRLHEPKVVPALLAALRKPQETNEVRVATAVALGQYPEDRVFQALVASLDAPDLAVNVAAQRSLETLTGQAFGGDSRAWLTWYRANSETAFAGGREYLYPTFERDVRWYERLAFWVPREYESPAPPAGLRSAQERRTYTDSDEPEAEEDSPR